jgi:uroporphyrin-III C-methyltransferase/precorrin-2 dehydrogenase/sirohydrochlorin ferrochelatase
MSNTELLPLFLNLTGRRVLLVGGGSVATAKLEQLLAAGAEVRVVAPDVSAGIVALAAQFGVPIDRRGFDHTDLDGAWLVVAAAHPDVNRLVAEAAEARRLFVNAVDDPRNASAFLSGVVRRDGVTLAISTSGAAPGLTGLLREALAEVLPGDLAAWVHCARSQRIVWRERQVPMRERRPLLLRALNELYARSSDPDASIDRTKEEAEQDPPNDGAVVHLASSRSQPAGTANGIGAMPRTASTRRPDDRCAADERATRGFVSLVGAGPGDPGLLTRRAVARLRAADLVLYDALIDRRVLAIARHAQRFFVGKRSGRRAMSQQTINALMIRAARRGKRVVRLKGGDPFVFGRGGEEMLALRAGGIRAEVVPGVTSAVAAPALAGIPVTHRKVSSAFLVVGGHDQQAFASAIDAVVPQQVTLVVLMGIGQRAMLAETLVARGWRSDTPAAIIVDASRVNQTVWRGTIGDLAADRADIDTDGPGTIVVGDVVAVTAQAGTQSIAASTHAGPSGAR